MQLKPSVMAEPKSAHLRHKMLERTCSETNETRENSSATVVSLLDAAGRHDDPASAHRSKSPGTWGPPRPGDVIAAATTGGEHPVTGVGLGHI